MPSKKFYNFGRYKEDQGLVFTATYNVIASPTTVASVIVTTPTSGSGIYTMIVDVGSDKSGVFTFSELPSFSGGTVISSYNHNRTSSNASGIVFTQNPTIVTSGTVLEYRIIAGVVPQSKASTPQVGTHDWTLAANTNYLLTFTPDATTTNTVMNIFHYKE